MAQSGTLLTPQQNTREYRLTLTGMCWHIIKICISCSIPCVYMLQQQCQPCGELTDAATQKNLYLFNSRQFFWKKQGGLSSTVDKNNISLTQPSAVYQKTCPKTHEQRPTTIQGYVKKCCTPACSSSIQKPNHKIHTTMRQQKLQASSRA
jgi:hypothetical protein